MPIIRIFLSRSANLVTMGNQTEFVCGEKTIDLKSALSTSNLLEMAFYDFI